MSDDEYNELIEWLSVLKEVVKEYSFRTIDNIIENVEARVKYEKDRRK